jgi:hypothetical protein
MPSILDPIPNNPFYYPTTYAISTPQGSVIAGTGISIDQFGVMNVASTAGGTVTSITAGTGLLGGTITTVGTIDLDVATPFTLGGVKVGANLFVAGDGTLSTLPPNPGTINNIVVGGGLSGGGTGPGVTINLNAASTTQVGGVIVGNGISVTGGLISLTPASVTQVGGVQLATSAEVISGGSTTKVVTPAGLSAKVASTSALGIVLLSDSVASNDSTKAATQTAAKTAYDAAVAAQVTASAALPKSGGTMTGPIVFAPGQSYAGIVFPVATTLSTGVVSVGPGLQINPSGVLSTTNNGTVTAVTAGIGLGAPASGNIITNAGTINLIPPSSDGTKIGGVKAGANISIAFDGTISVPGNNFIASNNPYAFNSYIWPAPLASPALPCPGATGQVLTIANSTTGQLSWTSTGTLQSVVAGPGISVSSTPTSATVSLTSVPSLTPGTFGATALIPTFTVNAYGQLTSTGLANPYPPFQNATQMAPPSLVLDFTTNDTNWQWTLQGNTTFENPLNAQSGMTGCILLTQNPTTPAVVTWGTAWQFANLTPYTGNPTAGTVDLIQFIVVSPTYIIVTNIVENIG